MLEVTVGFFLSFFANPSALGIGLAFYFGAIWLIPYWPPLFRNPYLWLIAVVSAFLTLAAVSFIQIPLQALVGEGLARFWSQEVIMDRILLFGIPQILLSGLVQEGAKLVPIVIYWRSRGKNLSPKMGLAIGAVAGAAFGIFEAAWVHNTYFAAVNFWEMLQTGSLMALAPFWERFFVVAAHTAFSALAGYGLAKGKGWQFYLIASGLHALLNYSAVLLLRADVFTAVELEIYVASLAPAVTGVALWLRWRREV